MSSSFNSDDLVDLGEEHHKAGRLEEAESHYRKALEMDPGHPGALYYLANITYEDGRLDFAAELLNELLRAEPNDAEALHLLGKIKIKENDLEHAVKSIERALLLQPRYAQAYYSLGDALARKGDLESALAKFQQAIVLNPGFLEAHFAVANIYQLQNNPEAALSTYRRLLNEKPDMEAVHLRLAELLISQEQLEQATEVYQKALTWLPNSLNIYRGLSSVLMLRRLTDDAILGFEQALRLDSNCLDVQFNLGKCLIIKGRNKEAAEIFEKLAKSLTSNPETQFYLGLALSRIGRLARAIGSWRKALELNPNYVEAHSSILSFIHYIPQVSRENIFWEHVKFGDHFETHSENLKRNELNTSNPNKRLRVGFVSADLYSHPVGFFFEAIVQELARSDAFDIVIYATNSKIDSITESLRAKAHQWIPAFSLSDDALTQKIRDDNIDILVDLSGHTADHRLPVFARKPAPIQVTWLGYWDTTGLKAVDYILCDRFSVHVDEEKYFVEKPWYLPNTRLCFTEPAEDVPNTPLPALTKNYITFGCFNNLVKMNERVVSVWSRILKSVPDSRLLLKWSSLSERDVREEVKARFAERGIEAGRLQLQAASPRRDYLAAYQDVDIALDPFPFPGGTTSVEGIWMGVPMITLQGESIISRQGESILHNLNMQDWIARNEDHYVELAIQKAADITGLAKLREGLRDRLTASPLCNAALFAKNLDAAFKQMWQIHCGVQN